MVILDYSFAYKMEKQNVIFRQLFEPKTSTFTYILADSRSREGLIIDSVFETVQRDLNLLAELKIDLKYILETHLHADHVTGAAEIRKKTGAKSGISKEAMVTCADLQLEDQHEITFGQHVLKAVCTPGHTNSCMSFIFGNMVFTGDCLLIRSTGRTDFQQGSSHKLYQSITAKLFTLPGETVLYPGHDYKGFNSSTIDEEKRFNPRIGNNQSENAFVKIMSELKLAPPLNLAIALPANQQCGEISVSN